MNEVQEVVKWLRGLAQRNRVRPGSHGMTEFGHMATRAANLIEHYTNTKSEMIEN